MSMKSTLRTPLAFIATLPIRMASPTCRQESLTRTSAQSTPCLDMPPKHPSKSLETNTQVRLKSMPDLALGAITASKRKIRQLLLFNMSRTLSRDKIGPDPDNFGARPFLYLKPPAATSACLSDARLRSLISARGSLRCWAIRCYGWGCLVDSTVCLRGWRLRRSQKKRPGFAPTASDRTAGWDGSRYVGTAFPKASRSRPCGPPPSTST